MASYKSEFLNIMEERGFVHQCSNFEELDKSLSSGEVVTAYSGFDATATSLHIGNLLGIMMLRWFQKCGHKPITLMGGGTSMVGDPSGKDASRNQITEDDIQNNMKGIKTAFEKFITYGEGKTDALMVNNADWLKDLNYIEFLRDYGKHFSINRMLTMDSVKSRLTREQSLSFLEFNYMILQGYDFLELNRKYNCTFQLGGSDQWGNIINGVELTRRVEGKEVFALTCPLLLDGSGKKMGKTASGQAMWLNADMMSPYDYYQYWRNVDDKDVVKLLKLYTDLPMSEIQKISELEGAELNDAKKILAFEATAMCHGKDEAEKATQTAKKTFEQGGVSGDLPTIEIEESRLGEGVPLFVLLKEAGLAKSNGEARRLIKGGGAKINDEKIASDEQTASLEDFNDNVIKLSAGKKRHALVKIAG